MNSDRKDVIFIVVDSLRADYLSCYGSSFETPSFDKIAEKGVVFNNMYASGPNTPISHSAMFTGKHPSETGVVLSQMSIPDEIPLISTWLKKEGYHTVGFSGPSIMGSEFGFARGFDEYHEPYKYSPKNVLEYFSRAAKSETLRKPMIKSFFSFMTEGFDDYTKLKINSLENKLNNSEEPLFYMANLMTPHHPYRPPRPYIEESTPEADRSRWGILEEIGADIKIDDVQVRDERLSNHLGTEEMARYLADTSYFREEELNLLSRWYHGAIRYTGDQLLRMIERIEDNGGLEDKLIIITSDHGEFFGEHNLISHSHFLHEEVTRVPLFVLGSDLPKGSEREKLASHIDLFDTICDLIGVSSPESTSGIPLFGDRENEIVISEHGEWSKMREERSGKAKYMSSKKSKKFTSGRKTVRSIDYRYEIDSDGNEKYYTRPHDIEVNDRDVPEWLRERLFDTIERSFDKKLDRDIDMTKKIEQNLKDLGYIE